MFGCWQASTAQKSHERYMHYFKHYEQHLDSLKKEKLEKYAESVPTWCAWGYLQDLS